MLRWRPVEGSSSGSPKIPSSGAILKAYAELKLERARYHNEFAADAHLIPADEYISDFSPGTSCKVCS
jgi:hypothetical protein